MKNSYRSTARRAVSLTTLLGALALTGCAGMDSLGKVQPWEKGNLARPEMGFETDPLRKAFLEHTYTSKESASGGTGVAGGGCGCN